MKSEAKRKEANFPEFHKGRNSATLIKIIKKRFLLSNMETQASNKEPP
jgi:hypothetical protein